MFKRNKKNNKGFTLVELVIVIAILAILVGLLAPQYTKYVEKSRKAADASNMDEIVKVIKIYAADPANELSAGKYTVKIGNTKSTENNKATTVTCASTTDQAKLEAALTESIPSWKDTTVKSQKWNNGTSSPIYAIVTVGEDGGTSVQYSLTDTYAPNNTFENYMTTGSEEGTK